VPLLGDGQLLDHVKQFGRGIRGAALAMEYLQ
jgi:hypothetical protein